VLGTVGVLVAFLFGVSRLIRHQTDAPALERRLLAALGSPADSLYRVRVGSSHLSILAGTYLATDIEIMPDSAAFSRRRQAGTAVQTHYAMRAGSFRVTGLDVWGFLWGSRFKALSAVADSLMMEIYLDRTAPVPLDSLRLLPHESFRTIPVPVRVDTFRIQNGEIRYSERAIDGARPGMIRFANTHADLYNLTNDPRGPNLPVVLDVRTLLAGSAPSAVILEYDFRAPKLNLDFRGTVRDLDATRLNDMTVNLEGLRLPSGHLDSAWFKFRVRDGVANGDMQLLYRHLEAEFVDKVTRKGGLSEWFKSLIANTFVVKGHNRRDGDHTVRTASIRGFARTPNLPLSKYVWYTLREGLFLTITGEPPATAPILKSRPPKRP
jgi:hypothetical protein